MPTGHAHTRRFMPSQAEAMPMRTPRSSSQWSVYWPIGIPASMTCWKTFGASAAAVRVVLMGVRLLGELVAETNSGDVGGPSRVVPAGDPRNGSGDGRRARCLSSGLSPSVLEFHQVHRPLAAAG